MEERTRFELIALGTGTCVSGLGWEKEERWPPGYLLKGIAHKLVLLEASEGIRYRIQDAKEEYTNVSDILVSHLHPDHFNLVPFVQSIAIKQSWSRGKFKRSSLRIFGPKGIEVDFWKIWKIQVPEHPKSIYGLLKLEFIELSDNKSINFYHSQLTAFNVFHALDKITALAFRLKTAEGVFTYSGDSGLCPGLEKAADKTDVFLCDASADIGDDKSKTSGHLNPFQAGSLADRIGVKKLWLTHYSGKNSPEEMIANCKSAGFGGEIRVLRDGDRLFPF